MIRLTKLSIWDFKGLSGGPHIINLQDTTLLCGPNGYGKSTIFEAIELCITGKISRLERNIEIKTEDSRSVFHAKSPLHNNSRPIKLELEFYIGEIGHVIRLKKEMNGNERLSEYANNIDLYLKKEDEDFIRHDRDSNSSDLANLANSFRLSTYISQDDASYFLRRRQQERHKDLSALTDTISQHTFLTKLEKFHRTLSGHYRTLDQKVNSVSLRNVGDAHSIPFLRLLEGDEINIFDRKFLYENVPYAELSVKHNLNIESVREIESFTSSFKFKDYSNFKKHRYLTEPLEDKEFVESLALSLIESSRPKMLESPKLMYLIQKELLDESKIKFYLVKNLINEETLPEYKKAYQDYNNYFDILHEPDNEIVESTIENIVSSFLENRFVPHDKFFENAGMLWGQYTKLRQTTSAYSQIMSKLISAREELALHRQKLDSHVSKGSTSCVYCGYDWETQQQLVDAYARQEEMLNGLAKVDGESLSRLIKTMDEQIAEPLRKQFKDLKAKHDTYAYTYSSLNSIVNVNELLTSVEMIHPGFQVKYPPFVEPSETEFFEQMIEKYQGIIQESLNKEQIAYHNLVKRITSNGRNMASYSTALLKSGFKSLLLEETTPTIESFEKFTIAIKEEIERFSQQFSYDPSAISRDNLITLRKYLADTPDHLLESTISEIIQKIPNKLAYLSEQFSIAQSRNYSKIKDQRDKMKAYKDSIGDIILRCRDELRIYENSVTRSLQIPFYVISARVLQNSPHGEGGLVIKPQGNEASKSLIIDVPGETQDAINQLSSGQLMVVSLAFFLALNIQTRDRGAKLLLIDDPVQDMDALNSHALIDVLRREFTGADDGYQLVASTSSDMLMNLMKYKMKLQGESIIRVQELFFDISGNINEPA